MNTQHGLHSLYALLFLSLTALGCTQAEDYDDPEPDVIVTQDTGQNADPGSPSDPGTPEDLSTPEDLGATVDTIESSDTELAEDTFSPSDESSEADVEPPADTEAGSDSSTETPESCLCTFQLWATQPNIQSFVWLTGDFLDPAWPESPEQGALEMVLEDSSTSAFFKVEVQLAHDQTVEYKYRLGWEDNPGPHWADQTGTTNPSLPNSIFTADCTSECAVGP